MRVYSIFFGAIVFSLFCNINGYIWNRNRHINTVDKPRSPVIFIPGDGGNQVEARLNKSEVVHYFCVKKADWFNIWLNLELLPPLIIDCWIDNVKLYYDNVTRTTNNAPGVETRIPGWGHTEPVEWIDPTHNSYGAYFKTIGNALVSSGWIRDKSIRGAPYDFRKAPNENKQWFVDLKVLVEETYEMNEQVPITFIAHSMGATMTLVFLQQQTKSWKEKYISSIISLAGAWAGSVKAIKVYAMGDDLDAFALRASVMREEQISNPSLAWMLPSPYFWKPNDTLVRTTSRSYSIEQLEDFFIDLDYRNGWEMHKDVAKYKDFTPPGVAVHAIYGVGTNTVEKLLYENSAGLNGTPTLLYGDGDGTVNVRSLRAYQKWINLKQQNNKAILYEELDKVDHMGILSDKRVVMFVLNALDP